MTLSLREWGDPGGAPVVCLHGVTAHGGRFARLAARLDGRRVLAPDLRGHGRSPWEPPWGIEAQLADVVETVEDAGVTGPAVWIGHSFGGRLVLELAAREPGRVERAVLLDPAVRIRPDNALALSESERSERTYAAPEDALPPPIGGPLHRTPPELLEEERREHLVRGEDGRWRWRYCSSAVVSILGELAGPHAPVDDLRIPALVVLGRDESVVGPRQRARFRDAEIVEVPGGHVVLLDALEETAAAVARFLGLPCGEGSATIRPGAHEEERCRA